MVVKYALKFLGLDSGAGIDNRRALWKGFRHRKANCAAQEIKPSLSCETASKHSSVRSVLSSVFFPELRYGYLPSIPFCWCVFGYILFMVFAGIVAAAFVRDKSEISHEREPHTFGQPQRTLYRLVLLGSIYISGGIPYSMSFRTAFLSLWVTAQAWNSVWSWFLAKAHFRILEILQ